VGEFEAALRYSYSLLKHNQNSPIAYMAFSYVVMASGLPEELLAVGETARSGAAVALVEERTEVVQWWVIEDDADLPRLPEDLSSEDGLALKLVGHGQGDRILVAGDEVDGRWATVREVVSKYVYRARKCFEEWQLRFPSEPGIEMFRMRPGGGESGSEVPDLTPIIRRAYERKRTVEEMLKNYKETPATIDLLAGATGSHFVETMQYLAASDGVGIHCCDGRLAAFDEALANARTASVYVLDLSAIVTLVLLGLDELLAAWPTSLVVSSDTVRELRQLRDTRRHVEKSRGWVVPAETDLGIRFVDTTEDQQRENREQIETLIERVTNAATCRDCGELGDMAPEQRDEMINYWFGVRRVWTQAVLEKLAADGFLSPEDLHKASARLMGYDYVATRYNEATLHAAAVLADWNAGSWPLEQVLRAFGQGADPQANLIIAGLFMRRILAEPLLYPRHGEVAMRVLDQLAEGPFGVSAVETLRHRMSRLFGLDVAAAEHVDEWFRNWLSIRRSVS